jgi:hypothetical protein
MDMKNVKNANYLQVDHKIRRISEGEGVVILPSPKAWKRFNWSRKWFTKKPKEGYFVWVKKQVDFPLTTCVTVMSPKISQNLTNLLVVEKNLKVKANVVCNAAKNNLYGSHKATGRLILKDNATLEYNHSHKWGKEDFVNPEYEFILGKNSKLIYTYRNLFPPKNLRIKTVIQAHKNSSTNLNFVINGVNSKINLHDVVFLKEKDSNGIIRLRLIGRKNSQIDAVGRIVAEAPGRGHLDCQGLLIDKKSSITLTPELVDKNKNATITHEASIGKIDNEQLNYLRARGLNEKEAIDLIVGGFLGE